MQASAFHNPDSVVNLWKEWVERPFMEEVFILKTWREYPDSLYTSEEILGHWTRAKGYIVELKQ